MRESVQGRGDVDVAAIVAILLAGRQAARVRKPADRRVETDEEIRATEHLLGSGRCNGQHRVQRVVHVYGHEPTPSVAGRGRGRAVRLWGRAGVPHGRVPARLG